MSSLGGNASEVIDDATASASFSAMTPGGGSETAPNACAAEPEPTEGTTSTVTESETGGHELMTCLPPPTKTNKELIALVQRAMVERKVNQSDICSLLSLSPVHFSMWLHEKQARATALGMRPAPTRVALGPIPTHASRPPPLALPQLAQIKAEKYAAAIELWIDDPNFVIRDSRLTDTNRSQVPAGARARGRGRGRDKANRTAKAPHAASDASGTGVKRERPGQWSQPTTVHGITCEMLADLPEVSFQLVPPRRPRSRVTRPATFSGTDVDTTFCIVTARFVGASEGGNEGRGEAGGERRPIEMRAETEVLAWLHRDGVLRPPGERVAGPQSGMPARCAHAKGGGGEAGGREANNGGLGGESGGGAGGGGTVGSGAHEVGSAQGYGGVSSTLAPDAAPLMPLPPAVWPGEADCLAANKPQRKRKAINYMEADELRRSTAAASPPGRRGAGGGADSDTDGVGGCADGMHTGMASAAVADPEGAVAMMGGDAEAQRGELRRRLQWTIEGMAAAPLELRRKLNQATYVAQRSRCQLSWRAFCSICGKRFERVEGPLQLASHCGLHHLHELLEYRCALSQVAPQSPHRASHGA